MVRTGYLLQLFAFEHDVAASARQCTAFRSLFAILEFGIFDGLPLHVGWIIWTVGAQGDDMVDDVAGAGTGSLSGGRAWVSALEGVALLGAAVGFGIGLGIGCRQEEHEQAKEQVFHFMESIWSRHVA